MIYNHLALGPLALRLADYESCYSTIVYSNLYVYNN